MSCRECHKRRRLVDWATVEVRASARLCARNESPRNLGRLRWAAGQLAEARRNLSDHTAECV